MKSYLKRIIGAIVEMHLSPKGKLSWVRCASSIIIFVVLVNYSARSIFREGMDFGIHEFYVIAGCMGFKVAQRWKESPEDSNKSKDKLENPDNV